MNTDDLFSVAASAWVLYLTLGSLCFCLWTRWVLRRNPVLWLRHRGVECDLADLKVLWVEGQIGTVVSFFKQPAIALVITPSALVLERQIPNPFTLRRGRAIIECGATLRLVQGRIADPKRRCLVASVPPERLIGALRSAGWLIKDVPF